LFFFFGLTVKNTLPVVVGLDVGQVGTDPLVIDLILDIGQQNESSHDTLAAGALNLSRDLAVPDVMVVGEQSTDTLSGHGHDQVAILSLGLSGVSPVGGGSVTEVLILGDSIVEVLPGVGLAFTDGHGGARVEREGGERVATTETEGTGTTLTIFYACN